MRLVFGRLLESLGYEVETARDGVGALASLPLGFDLILIDGDMPGMDGFEAVGRIRQCPDYGRVPIVMITGLVGVEHRKRALSSGVNDVIAKPVDRDELALRCRAMLELKRSYDELARERESLEMRVLQRTEDLRRALADMGESERRTRAAHEETVRRLMIAAEYKDMDTAGHIDRIGIYSQAIAEALPLAPGVASLIREAATMHDVGKIGIPDRILLKRGPLDETEWEIMRSHVTIGAEILRGSDSPLIQMGHRIALSHHEKWDGTGYPRRLARDEIPIEGRICAVADFFDALTMRRPYRDPVPVEEVLEMIRQERGRHFDPEVVDAFFTVAPRIIQTHERMRRGPSEVPSVTDSGGA